MVLQINVLNIMTLLTGNMRGVSEVSCMSASVCSGLHMQTPT
jgi:hypothetical protein